MSDLLNSASLVMIPSGYAEDKVYSAVPTDGSGDLSFTRASNGTRINSAGLVEVVPWNLIDNSNSFTSGAWILQEVTSTSGQSDPLGGNFGWRFNETTATGQHRFYYAFIAFNTGVVTQSIYVKSLGRDQIFIGSNSNTESLIFTFSTETISSVTGFTSTSATSVGGGWYRLTATFFGFSPINCLFVQGYNGGLSYAGDTSKGFYAFGAQLNIGSTAKPYFPTTDRLNVPRLTYQNGGGGCPSLLLEKQSTNLCVQSNAFNTTPWAITSNLGTNPVITTNYGISPDGTQNASRVQLARTNANASYSQIFQYPVSVTSGQPYTWSVWLKSLSGTPTISIVGDFGRPPVTLTSEWVRYYGTGTAPTSIAQLEIAILGSTFSSGNSLTADFLIWGYQFEQSSYPTSYIPTTSSSATRVADACYKTGISSLIGQTEGTALLDFQFNGVNDAIILDIAASGLSPQNRIILYQPNSTAVQFIVLYNDTNPVSIASSSYAVGQRLKVAIAYKENDFAFYINGVQIGIDSSGSVPATSRIDIGNRQDGAYPASITVNEFYLSKTRLTNAQLASLTTI